MGHNVTLQAGTLSVSIQSDEDDLQDVAQAAHVEMSWMMTQWSEVSGSMVQTRPSMGLGQR
jgi:hypothetical protein